MSAEAEAGYLGQRSGFLCEKFSLLHLGKNELKIGAQGEVVGRET